ncbi:tyrosine-tRNA ligase [Gaertneriomyces semiglobifer]|nr:tyrosine-tRNA ligase [Gaertneriomyces semiglobifer]
MLHQRLPAALRPLLCRQCVRNHRRQGLLTRSGPRDPVSNLAERGLVQATSSPKLPSFLSSSPTAVYAGFDPTAQSLHVGNLMQIIALLHFQATGHQALALLGGATGTIGDPSGRSTERNALNPNELQKNMTAIHTQLNTVFSNAKDYISRRQQHSSTALKPIRIINNLDWFKNMTVLDFLGNVGRMARVSAMLAKDSVRSRLESPEGISFTEFSYQLLQGYDYYHLYTHEKCRVQIGGSDQWGNITAGMDMIRRKCGQTDGTDSSHEADPLAYGVTSPLVTTASGEKFGKSAGNAVWLDANMLSCFDFYQFFRRTPDTEVARYLRYFTFIPVNEIEALMLKSYDMPEAHLPQRTLAAEVTELVHGAEAAEKAIIMSDVLYDKTLSSVNGNDIVNAFSGDARLKKLPRSQVIGADIIQVAVAAGGLKSKSAGRKLLQAGGLYLNKRKVSPAGHVITEEDLLDGTVCLIRTGKEQYRIVQIV